MPGRLTTHVLDTARGRPAAGLRVELFRLDGEAREALRTLATNADGRTDEPLLPEGEWRPGTYEIVFHAGDYLGEAGRPEGGGEAGPRFLDRIPIRFGMSEETHHHVPLLLSPFGYSTYRGS